MNTCKNCRYWYTGINRDRQRGTCEALDMTDWDNSQKIDVRNAVLSVEVSDDTGLDVELVTGPDFGCTNFVVKV